MNNRAFQRGLAFYIVAYSLKLESVAAFTAEYIHRLTLHFMALIGM